MAAGVPICLLLSLVECAVIVVIYYFCSDGLGSLLQSREQKILETVTAKDGVSERRHVCRPEMKLRVAGQITHSLPRQPAF